MSQHQTALIHSWLTAAFRRRSRRSLWTTLKTQRSPSPATSSRYARTPSSSSSLTSHVFSSSLWLASWSTTAGSRLLHPDQLPHVFSSCDHRSKIVAVLHHGISGPSRLFPAVLYRRGHLQIVKLVSSNGDFSHIYTSGLAPWPCSAPPWPCSSSPSKKKLRSFPMVKF